MEVSARSCQNGHNGKQPFAVQQPSEMPSFTSAGSVFRLFRHAHSCSPANVAAAAAMATRPRSNYSLIAAGFCGGDRSTR